MVNDDPLVLRVYGHGLRRRGFEVENAEDGLAAARALRVRKPDVLVVNLMMPNLSGVDLLKQIRAESDLANLPVIVLSNAYMTDLAREAAALVPGRVLLKAGCTPALLADLIHAVLQGRDTVIGVPQLVEAAAGTIENGREPEPVNALHLAATVPAPGSSSDEPIAPFSPRGGETKAPSDSKPRLEFLEAGAKTCSALQNAFQAFHNATSDAERGPHLQSLYRKIHFLAVSSRIAECSFLSQMASVLEAFLFELIADPARVSPSMSRTIASAIDLLGELFENDQKARAIPSSSAHVLVVDDDKASNLVVVSALRKTNFEAEGANDPIEALKWLRSRHYDLILLDLEMPGINGFEFCRHARQLPDYRFAPIVYVTAHSEFENRVKAALSGAQDLIAKPIFPMELATKVVTLLMKSQLSASTDPAEQAP